MQFTITLEETELKVIGSALGELPFKIVASLVQKIDQQVVAQSAAPTESSKDAPQSLE